MIIIYGNLLLSFSTDVNVQSDVKINMDGKKPNDCPPGRRDCVPSRSSMPDVSKDASVVVNGIPVKLPAELGRRKRSREY